VLSTEMAWREWWWKASNQLFNGSQHAANAASVVGMAAMPGGFGGLSSLATAVAHENHGEQFSTSPRLPSLFELQAMSQ
jgi:hypothetical protein